MTQEEENKEPAELIIETRNHQIIIQRKSKHSMGENNKNKTTSKNILFQHTVIKGDTLWHIASKYLDNPYLYPELAKLSKINNPDLIYPGDIVTMKLLR